MKAVYCYKCKEIIFSRARHDFRSCSCGNAGIDDMGHRATFKALDSVEFIELDDSVLLEQMLYYDWKYGNRTIVDEFKDGYYGKFKLSSRSSMAFYRKLIIGDSMLAEMILLNKCKEE